MGKRQRIRALVKLELAFALVMEAKSELKGADALERWEAFSTVEGGLNGLLVSLEGDTKIEEE